MKSEPIPSVRELYDPVMQALHNLGGMGTTQEIFDEIAKILNLNETHDVTFEDSDHSYRSVVRSRVGWAQTHLKRSGLLENPIRGVWALSDVNKTTVRPEMRNLGSIAKREKKDAGSEDGHDRVLNSVSEVTTDISIPTLDKLMNPLLQELQRSGGSGTNEEINEGVAKQLRLTENELKLLHTPGKGRQTEFEYRLSLARRYLKAYGLLENPKVKLWTLTEKGSAVTRVNPFAVILHYQFVSWEERSRRERSVLPELTDIDETMFW